MRASALALCAALGASIPAVAGAQPRCSSDDNRARIEDAQSRIFTRPASVDYEGAERGLRFAMRECPTDPEVNGLMGLALLGMQSYVLAEQHMQTAMTFRDLDPAWWRENGAVVTARLTQLRQTLGSIMVSADVAGAVLHLPDERAVVLPLREPVRVPAGRFSLRVTAAGREDLSREVEVSPDGVERVSVTLTPRAAPEAAPQASAPAAAPPREATPVAVREVPGASPWRTIGWVTAGFGAAAVIAGAVQWANSDAQLERAVTANAETPGAWGAWARYSYAVDARDGSTVCERASVGASADARTVQDLCADNQQARTMAWAFSALGVALLGGGALMALVSSDGAREERPAPRLSATLGPRPSVSLEVPF